MKFNVQGKAFLNQLQSVSKVLNSKNAITVLDNFLFTVEGDRLTITGSDSENILTASVEIFESECDGAVAVPAKRLLEVVKEVASQPLTFVINDVTKEIDLVFLTGHFSFMGVNASEYPVADKGKEETIKLTVPSNVIVKGIDSTLFAVSTDTIRPMMTGIYWDIHKEDITFVGSDTHKLVKYVNSEYAPGIESSFILPAKPAAIIKGLLEKEEGDVVVEMDSRSAIFNYGDYSLSCRFINGNYPNYNRVIPVDNPYSLTVDRVTLLAAVRRVSIFASKASNLVKFRMSDSDLRLSAQDLDYSTQAEEKVECEYSGQEMTIGFNASHMIEMLNNLHSDNVIIKVSDPARPALFEPLEKTEGESVVMIQMPLQVIE